MIFLYQRLFFVAMSAALLLSISSCNTAFQAHQDMVLTLSERGDIKATGSINKTKEVDESVSFNGQIAYSPIKHLGLSAKYFSYSELLEDNFDPFVSNTSKTVNGGFTEFAIGGYINPEIITLGDDMDQKLGVLMPMKFTADLYIGGGRGDMNVRYASSAHEYVRYNRLFGHIGLHFQWKIIKLSYAFKLISLDYKEINLTGDGSDENYNAALKLKEKNPFFYRSSSLRMQMGPRHAQVYVEMNFNSLPEYMRNLYFYEKIGGIGLIVDINEFYKKR